MIQDAQVVVYEIETMCGQSNNGDDVEPKVLDIKESHSFFYQCYVLFAQYPLRTLFASTLDISQAFGGYGVSHFLTLAILPGTIPQSDIPTFFTISSIGSFPGFIFAALLTDRIGRKKLLPLAYTLSIISVYLIYLTYKMKSESLLITTGFFYNVCYAMAWSTGYSMYSEVFPTFIRSTGIGMAVSIGRLGGFASPFLTSLILTRTTPDGWNILGSLLLVMSFFALTVVAAIPWYIYGTEGKGASLEECAGETVVKVEATKKV